MRIKTIAIQEINPAPYNPRIDLKPGNPEYERLKRSVDEFGCVEPLVWNQRSGNLVGGHQRFKVLVARGDRETDVSVVDLPPEKEKALNIALNKISGDWDPRKLAQLLDELVHVPNFDVQLTGFDVPDVNALIAESLPPPPPEIGTDDQFDVEAELAADRRLVTQPGDLIELRTLDSDQPSSNTGCIRSAAATPSSRTSQMVCSRALLSTPQPIVALPCGSRSTISTRRRVAVNDAARSALYPHSKGVGQLLHAVSQRLEKRRW